MPLTRDQIAKRIAKEVQPGFCVNLGIGIPTLVANFIPEGIVLRAVNLQETLGDQVVELRRVRLKLLEQFLPHGRSPVLVDVLRHHLHGFRNLLGILDRADATF